MMVIHGRYDILAMPKYGEQLATRLECPCMMLEGAHFVTRECGPEINLLLNHMVYHGQRIHNNPRKYLKPAADRPVVVQNGDMATGSDVELATGPAEVSQGERVLTGSCDDVPDQQQHQVNAMLS